jgi:hypothetical protein
MGTSVSSWKAISAERHGKDIESRRRIVDDPGVTRLDIDLYRRKLKLNLSDAARNETLALLADAELRLQKNTIASALRKQEQ